MLSAVTVITISSIKRHPTLRPLSHPLNHGNGGKEFVVGAILPFTGSFSSIGKPVKVALEKV